MKFIYLVSLLVTLFYVFSIKTTEAKLNVPTASPGLPLQDKLFLRSWKRAHKLRNVTDELSPTSPQNKAVILYFYTTWCPACKKQKGEMEKVEKAFGSKVGIKKFDCDQQLQLAKKYSIVSLPTVMIYVKKKLVHRSDKMLPFEEMEKILKKYV